ncbi:MAG: hypothetical protein QW607_08110 [Desulfurococcaceae archaeon]
MVNGIRAVYGYFIYSLLNIAHNHDIRPDTHYPTVLGENESEKPFSAIPVAKKGLSDLFINIVPSTIDGFAVSYKLVSDGQNMGFGIKNALEDTYKHYPRFLRVMKLPNEDLLIKRVNFPVRVSVRTGRGKNSRTTIIEIPTLIDGLFSKTLNKHIGFMPEQVLHSPRFAHLPPNWIVWQDYKPVVCGQTLNTYELITPPDEDVLDFVNYLKSTYNKPVYLFVSVEFLLNSIITYPAFVENVSRFINSLPVDGVVIQDDFSEGSWVAGTVNSAISTFLRNLYSQINKPKFYLPSYSTVKYVSFQDDTVIISESRNQLFNETKHGCIYTPPLIPFKECGYSYEGYNANTCDHANYYLQKENKPVLKHEEFMKVYPNLTFINEADKMYKPPNLLLDGLNNIVLKQHFFDDDIGLIQFPDIKIKQGAITTLQSAFYYQVYTLNYLANQLRNKTIFWNAFYLTPFWQVFTAQDNTITFYYTRIPYNFLVYFINLEEGDKQVVCCMNPQVIRDRLSNEEISLNIFLPQMPISDTFTGGNEGQFPWLTSEQSSLLNPYNYVNSKPITHKPFLITFYEKFYRRVDKQVFLEPVLAYVKGGQVSIIGQCRGIFAYTLPEHTDKVFLAVYRKSANELILAIGEDLVMADVIEYEDVSLGILTSQENPFVFYRTYITRTGEVEEQDSPPIVRFVDLP